MLERVKRERRHPSKLSDALRVSQGGSCQYQFEMAAPTTTDALRALADAARAVTAAATVDEVLDIVAGTARSVIGTDHGVARRRADGAPPGPRLAAPIVGRDGASVGLVELWDKYDGAPFTASDEAILTGLAQMAANAIDSLTLLAREHAARVEAEETGRRLLREKQRAEALQRVGSAITASLELQEIVQIATDAATTLTPVSLVHGGEPPSIFRFRGVERLLTLHPSLSAALAS
jgi:hypothetical protein